ncbi:MAG: N-6 DNA methylase [archaeon]|nr:N-6 DNA methylase [archaeon]
MVNEKINFGNAASIPSGKLKCYISEKLRKDTPEERVRQDFARSLVEIYGYDKKQLNIEFPIKMGRSTKRADLVIFEEEHSHVQENIKIIIEVKKEDIKPSDSDNGIDQLKSYVAASINCEYAIWIGNEKIVFIKDEFNHLKKIPDIPKSGKKEIPIPTNSDLKPAINLKQTFKRIHNYIYANQGFHKDKAFEELQKLIFIKVYDEQFNPTLNFYILPDESIDDLRDRLERVFEKVKFKYSYIFDKNDHIKNLNDSVLEYIVSELYNFSLLNTNIDVKGEAYEQIVGTNLRGDKGEFFTPRTVCSMASKMVLSLVPKEKLITPGKLKILDPALGTGGFLIASLEIIKEELLKEGFEYDRLRDIIKEISNNNLYGIDFNEFLVKVSQMNMVMHGDGSSNIFHANSLDSPKNWDNKLVEKIPFESVDVILTNPPFGSKTRIDDNNILRQYDIHNFKSMNPRKSLPPEQLFIERCLNFLKPGGIMAMVLPDSILSNPGLTWLRKYILKKTFLIASIDLPVETFQPHTGTQTSILILKKKTNSQRYHDNYDIFMAIPEKVGHNRRGKSIYKTDIDGKVKIDCENNPIIDDDLPTVAEMFVKWIKTKGMI